MQAVVYLGRHVVSFEYFVSLYDCNNRLYIINEKAGEIRVKIVENVKLEFFLNTVYSVILLSW